MPVAYLCIGKVSHFFAQPELETRGWRKRLRLADLVTLDHWEGGHDPALGAELDRAQALAEARPNQAAVLSRQLDRLVGDDQMGQLFKVLSIHSPGLQPPGFEGPEASLSDAILSVKGRP